MTQKLKPTEKELDPCSVCGHGIQTMCYLGTGVCSILCDKQRKGEITNAERIAQGGKPVRSKTQRRPNRKTQHPAGDPSRNGAGRRR